MKLATEGNRKHNKSNNVNKESKVEKSGQIPRRCWNTNTSNSKGRNDSN